MTDKTDRFRIDSTKIMYHPDRVAQLLEAYHDWEVAKNVYPIYVEISPTGFCNHRCTFCSVEYIGYSTGHLDADLLGDRLHEMGSLGIKSIQYAGEGEPLLHKKINEIVEQTLDAGIDVSFITNGVLLDKLDNIEKLKWIRVSLNAGTRETYAKVHQTKPEDFDRVVANLKTAVQRKGACTIGIQMTLIPENQSEVENFKSIGSEIGLDYTTIKAYLQPRPAVQTQYTKFIPIVPAGDNLLVVRNNAFATQSIPYPRCLSVPYLWAYIMANGDVYACSAGHLLDDRFMVGNINTHTFKEIWQSDKRRTLWEFMKTYDLKECRVNCHLNQTNIYLDELVNNGVEHVNFI